MLLHGLFKICRNNNVGGGCYDSRSDVYENIWALVVWRTPCWNGFDVVVRPGFPNSNCSEGQMRSYKVLEGRITTMGAIMWRHVERMPPLFQTVGIQYAMFTLALIHHACSWNRQSDLKVTHENTPTAGNYPPSRTSFCGTITSCRKTAVVLKLK